MNGSAEFKSFTDWWKDRLARGFVYEDDERVCREAWHAGYALGHDEGYDTYREGCVED